MKCKDKVVPATVTGGGKKESTRWQIGGTLYTGAMTSRFHGAPELIQLIPLRENFLAAVLWVSTHPHGNGREQTLEEYLCPFN